MIVPHTLVTTSWDDGHPLDLRVADILAQHGMTGTFFVPLRNRTRPRLSTSDMRSLSDGGFEIGSHGMLHRNLLSVPRNELRWEIADSKSELEQLIGRCVRLFCYPIGRYNSEIISEVERAGYDGARTIRMLCTRADFQPLHVPTTLQAYRHPPSAYLRNLLRRSGVRDVVDYCVSLRSCNSWVELGRRLFDRVLREGGVWHLYGHSWEIDEHGLWGELEQILKYVAGRAEVRYVRTVDTLPSKSVCLPQIA
ncbi:MAG TPA: polysaccharide deacetylase family protein [Terriglobales bacterium]|nr:polysaccharide deacetylase family protein [Terriglobales bacterium]